MVFHTEVLTKGKIVAGKFLIDKLNEEYTRIIAAAWMTEEGSSDWRLYLACPKADTKEWREKGWAEFNRLLEGLIQNNERMLWEIDRSDLSVVSPEDWRVSSLIEPLFIYDPVGSRFSPHIVRAIGVTDLYVYNLYGNCDSE